MKSFAHFALVFLLPLIMGGQHVLPPIHNYKIYEYGADSKNWGLAANETGELFVANHKGLLHFNGAEWTLYELPNGTVVRSVAYIKGKIYTGSYEEFGYWRKDETGVLQYTSLTHLIQDHEFTSEEFWQILPYNDSVVFRSFSGIYSYHNDTVTIIDSEIVAVGMTVYEGELVVAGDEDFFQLQDGRLERMSGLDLLKGKTIINMAPVQEGLLIGTKLSGCYLFKNGKCSVWEASINAELKSQQLNKILPLNAEKIAFGTIKNGIYLYDTVKKTTERLNRETGLQNNTVLALLKFKDQLWAGLDNGLARVRIETPITFYTDFSGAVGTVYDLAFFKNVLYMGSNTGIYNFEDDRLHFIEGSQGHVWDLEVLDEALLGGHNAGTFDIDNGSLKKVSEITGGYQFAKVPEEKSIFLQGTYTGIAKYQTDQDGLWTVSRMSGLDFPVKQLCFENQHTVWAAHPYKGLYRMTIDATYQGISNIHEYTTEAIPDSYNIELFKIKNQIVIQSGGQWLKYDPISGRIIDFEEFTPYHNMRLINYDDDHFWFVDYGKNKELVYTDLKKDSLAIAETLLEERLVPDTEKMVKVNDSIYFITLMDGFGSINLNRLKRDLGRNDIAIPELAFFKDDQKRHPLKDSIFQIPFKNARNITVQMVSPALMRPKFHYRLQGPENQSESVPYGTLTFQNLPYGSYTLSVATVAIDNKVSTSRPIRFDIAPPWYLSLWSMAFYTLGLIGIIFLIRWYNRRKLRKKQAVLKMQLQREQAEHLAVLEKEKLEKEIRQKQKELARTTLSVAKKNELILELKDMLALNKDAFPNKQRYRSLTKKLDGSINEDEDWKHFEIHFKELHGDFFENLLERFPKLTPKDLKLCAYLKMNLSSKEIAPLMGITIRGVEIHRYRLRKKLDMSSSQNLSKFLIKFN
ncbi:MAG: Two component regulator three Y domain-containing protein [Pricia sp.]